MIAKLFSAQNSPNTVVGIILVVFTGFLFTTLDTGAKFASQNLPVGTVVWGRYIFHVIFLLLLMAGPRIMVLFRVKRPFLVIVRGTLLGLSTALFFMAISHMPLAEANAIGFITPLIVVALSIPILKEKVGPRRWAAVIVGFLGVLLIIRPGFQDIHWAYFLVLATCLTMASFSILTRILGSSETALAMLFYGGVIGAIMGTAWVLFVPGSWQTPTLPEWGLLAVLGLLGSGSHFVLINAYRNAPVSTLAPFMYSQLIWTTCYGFFVFGDFPDGMTFVGAGVIVASGLYILWREAQLRKKPEN